MNEELIPLYFALDDSKVVKSRIVTIKDIATVFCKNKDIEIAVQKLEVYMFPDTVDSSKVVTSMKIIELISTEFKNIQVQTIGATESILYYKNLPAKRKISTFTRTVFLMLVAFIGAAYSIMSYNCDVGAAELLNKLYKLYIGETPNGPTIGMLAYSLGLLIGIIIFFNHGIMRKFSDDPTPLQVQMRMYEQNVNKTLVIDSQRKNKTIDKGN